MTFVAYCHFFSNQTLAILKFVQSYCVCGGNKNPDVTRSQETIIQQFIFIFQFEAKLVFFLFSSNHDLYVTFLKMLFSKTFLKLLCKVTINKNKFKNVR